MKRRRSSFEKQSVVLFIFRAELVVIAVEAGVLPIDVDPVEVVFSDEIHCAIDEDLAALLCQRGVGEVFGPGPAAYRDEDLEVGVLLFQSVQDGEVLLVVREALDNFAVCHVGEGVVDARELLRCNFIGHEDPVAWEDIGDDLYLVGDGEGGACLSVSSEGGERHKGGEGEHADHAVRVHETP